MSELIALERLPEQQIKILKAIQKEGEKHLKHFYDTMKHFKYPERRQKAFDTLYYEKALPQIEKILREK